MKSVRFTFEKYPIRKQKVAVYNDGIVRKDSGYIVAGRYCSIRFTPGPVRIDTHSIGRVQLYTYDYSPAGPNKDNHGHKESDNGKTRPRRFDIDNPMAS